MARQEALDLAATIDDATIATTITGTVFANLGVAAQGRGDLDQSQTRYEQALRIFQEQGFTRGIARALRDLGYLYRDRGEFAASLASYRDSLELLGELFHALAQLGRLVGEGERCASALERPGDAVGDRAVGEQPRHEDLAVLEDSHRLSFFYSCAL